MKIKISILILAAVLSTPRAGVAGNSAGTTSALFLRHEPTARVTAMGGALAALDDESGAAYFNPAALGNMREHRLSFSAWSGVDENSRETFMSGIYHAGARGVFTLNYLRHSSGKEDIYDLGGNLSSVELSDEYALGAGWGYKLSGNLAAGAQAKMVKSKLAENYDDRTGTVDAGILATTDNGRFSLGAGVQNAVGELKYINAGDPLPTIIYGGAAMRFDMGAMGKLLLAADLHKPRDERSADAHAGAEYKKDILALRLGVKRVSGDNSVTAGGGITFRWASFDYGFQAAGELNQQVHKFTLNILFGGAKTGDEKAAAQAMSDNAQPQTSGAAPGTAAEEQPAPEPEPQQELPEAPAMPL
ncbi:MAG: PorV/PorQ family protein [Elusimicrobiales bacterium]|jgi:hypothetical protein